MGSTVLSTETLAASVDGQIMPGQPAPHRPHVPASNVKAMGKVASLDCDAVIFDLEDAVAPDAKAQARATSSSTSARPSQASGQREDYVASIRQRARFEREILRRSPRAGRMGCLSPRSRRIRCCSTHAPHWARAAKISAYGR